MKRVVGGRALVQAVLRAARECEFASRQSARCLDLRMPGAALAYSMAASGYSRDAFAAACELSRRGAFA